MSHLLHAESFKELVVYKKSRELASEIFEQSKTFLKEEQYSLTDQIRRASRSIGAQIAESRAKRRYVKHFISKLTDADGEQLETQHWIDVAKDCGYLDINQFEELANHCIEIGKLLNGMVIKADKFCKNYDR